MLDIKKINENNLYSLKRQVDNSNRYTILYGAGSTGQECLDILKDLGIDIDYFCDDDSFKWGQYIKGIKVINPKELSNFERGVNLIITSIYANRIYNKLAKDLNLVVYELFEILGENKGLINQIGNLDYKDKVKLENNLNTILNRMKDALSKKTVRTIGDAFLNDKKDISSLRNIVSDEECYFIDEVLHRLEQPFTLLDAGAYHGEIISSLKQLNIQYNAIYCFEAESNNYNILKTKRSPKIHCINKGLWKNNGKIFLEGDGAASKIVEYKTNNCIKTITIDDYFSDIPVNFIKMDIEGAEMCALMGGERVIEKERPVLAISIYHSLRDFIEIPLYLFEKLQNYSFYIRHHSMIFAETVLYCIPNN